MWDGKKYLCYQTLAHETVVSGSKDNNFQITHYFQNSMLSITNINSKFCSWETYTNTENLPMEKWAGKNKALYIM